MQETIGTYHEDTDRRLIELLDTSEQNEEDNNSEASFQQWWEQ
jgi:hypothetical protein